MRDHSTLSNGEFFVSVVWKLFIIFWIYKNILFRVLSGKDVYDSLKVLFFMIGISVFAFTVLFHNWKTDWSALACAVFPFGIYTVITYLSLRPWFIQITLLVAVGLSVVYFLFALMPRRVSICGNKRKIRHRNRVPQSFYYSTVFVSLAMVVLMAGIGWNGFFGTALLTSHVKAEKDLAEDTSVNTMDANKETVMKLDPDVWDTLSDWERLDVLQTVCNIEVHYLGLSDPITVQGDNLPDYVWGTYEDDLRLISISLDHLEQDDVEEVLGTLLHEVHHSYEARLAEAYENADPEYQNLRLFKDASYYSEEEDNYEDGTDDYSEYISQHMELDSENYAYYGVEAYYEKIDEWNME